MSKIETLVKDNEHLYPRTVEKAIYDDNGVRLDNKIGELKEEIPKVSSVEVVENLNLIRYGKLRILTGFITSNVNSTIAYLDIEDRPTNNVRCNAIDSSFRIGIITIYASDGEIFLQGASLTNGAINASWTV